MKKAVMALDGGGSNLRMLIVDQDTEEELYFSQISTGTNLSTVANKEEAIENIKNLIKDGYLHIPRDYVLTSIGLSSAGTEIKENKLALEQALEDVVETLKISSDRINDNPPKLYVTNDIDILLHSSDIALVAGTGTVCAVKYKDSQPYDNGIANEYVIEKFDGNGQFLGDKGAGFWIGKEALRRVSEMEDYGAYTNSKGELVETQDSYLRELVIEKVCKENNIPEEDIQKAITLGTKKFRLPEFVSLVYSATEDNNKPFDRAKVGNMFSKLVDQAALDGDEAANDILKQASIELFKNVKTAYERGDFENKEKCDILFSGSVLVHSDIVRYFLETVIQEKYPNVSIKLNKEKPVWSTIRYIKEELNNAIPEKTIGNNEGMDR